MGAPGEAARPLSLLLIHMTEYKIENSTKFGIILLHWTRPVAGSHLGLVQQLVVPGTLYDPWTPGQCRAVQAGKQKMPAGPKNCI